MFIYKITNNINRKVYIGQTIRPIDQRFNRHINDAINNILDTHLCRAIRKYGQNNFSIEVIDSASTQEELTSKESYWEKYYKSTDPAYGYNEVSVEFKSGGNTYQSKSLEEMAIIKEKLKISKSGSNNPNARKIKCKNIETGEELFFDTLIDCQKYFNENTHRFISTRVAHITRGLYKNKWAIAYINEEYQYDLVVNKKGTKVLVKFIDSGLDKEYDSLRLLCRELNIPDNIRQYLYKNKYCIYYNYEITVLD